MDSERRKEDESLSDARTIRAAADPLLEAEGKQLEEGRQVGHYVVLRQLGVGGMGEVYLARDTRLDRNVALKVLPAELSADRQRMGRFEQEARAASALNHPNILTIYEIGAQGDTHFIATEFIDGETLRKHLRGRRVKLHELLDLAIQIAAALDAAHEAGIVHRDVKPENVMVRRRDGIVKVLDFGLAKLAERGQRLVQQTTDTEAATQVFVQTEPGLVMGTVSYMSPEQTRAQAADARTDIWSLGVVLYEMLAGRLPFEGADAYRQIIAIQDAEAAPLSSHAEGVPEELQRIVSKALAKEREERYQTAKDFLIDLRNLKRRLELDAEIERSVAPTRGGSSAEGTRAATSVKVAAQTEPVGGARTTSSAEYIVGEIKKHKWGALVALAALAAVVAVGVGLYKSSRNKPDQPSEKEEAKAAAKPDAPVPPIKITPFVVNGVVTTAAISPDGNYVAYVLSDTAKEEKSVWLRHLPTASDVQIIPPSKGGYGPFVFSPDGNYIYYRFFPEGGGPSSLNKIPVVGGTPKRLIADFKITGRPWSFSPDGQRITFIREEDTGETKLIVSNEDGTDEQVVSSRKGDRDWLDGWPAWSPDGKMIAFYAGSYTGGYHYTLMTVRLEDGSEQQVGAGRWYSAWYLLWLPDGTGLLVNGQESQTGPGQVWRVSYPDGQVSKLTNDLNNYSITSLTRDASTLLAFQDKGFTDIWTTPPSPGGKLTQVTFTKTDGHWGVVWTPDGKIVFGSTAGGEQLSLWVMNADGSERRQLTSGANDWTPSVSPDGRYVAFTSNRSGAPNLWRVDIEGRDLRQLTSHGSEDHRARYTGDGKWIIFGSWRTGKITIWKIPAEGGDAVQLFDRACRSPEPSPDGRFVACIDGEAPPGTTTTRVFILPIEGGEPTRVIELPPKSAQPIRWTPDGRAIALLRYSDGVQNVWKMPLEGGRPTQLTGFKPAPTAYISYYAFSPDGKQLAVARSTYTVDLVLISNFK